MSVPEETAYELAELGGLLVADDLTEALDRVSRVAARAVKGCAGAGVTLFRDGQPSTGGCSSDWVAEVDQLQYGEHEGPCLDAAREGAVLRVRDLGAEVRWPSFAPKAAAAGVRSALALPMAARGMMLGALNLYAREPDAFTPADVALGQLLASHASLAVHSATLYFSSRELAEQLGDALESRAVIEQAKGILMARERCTADEAFERLRATSHDSARSLREVADALVASVSGS